MSGAPRNWAAYVPDLPGDVARLIREGIRLHLQADARVRRAASQASRESGEPIPQPTTGVELVDIA